MKSRGQIILDQFSKEYKNGNKRYISYNYEKNSTIVVFDPNLVYDIFCAHQKDFTRGIVFLKMKTFFGNGLLVAEDPEHLQNKRIIQQAFNKTALDSMIKNIYSLCNDALSERSDSFDLSEKSDKLMFDIISSCFFGVRFPQEYIDIYHEGCDITANTSILNFEEAETENYKIKFAKMAEFINEFITNNNDHNFLNIMKESGMDSKQMLDEAVTILGAGFETTSALNMWILIHLSQNKEVVEQIRKEMPNWVIENRMPTLSEISDCSILNKVIKETLRLNPPGYFTNRIANQDVKISDLEIKKGANIFASQYITHRIEEYYEDPETWNPYRWTEEFERSLPKGAYFPFGYGSKRCIGEHFANIVITIFILMLIHRFDFELSWDNPSINYSISMVPDGELMLKLGRRSDGEF